MPYSVQGFTIQATPKTLWSFLKVVSEDGIIGWGEFTLGNDRALIEDAYRTLKREIKDSDFELKGPKRGPLLQDERIRSAIYTGLDQAVFDIHGQKLGKKVIELLNPSLGRKHVPLYANINRSVIERTPDSFASRAVEATHIGFKAIKMAPFDGLSPEICQTDEGRGFFLKGVERIQAVRNAIAPDVSLMVDCHWRFDEKTAHEALSFLVEANVSWYECPLPENTETLASLVKLRGAANDRGMRVAGCETFTGWKDFQPFVENSVYDVIMPDAKYAGGMREIMDVAKRAAQHGVAVSLHNPSGPISHAISIHIAVALDNDMPLEFQFNETPLFDDIVIGSIPARTGDSKLPDGSGIGIALNEEYLMPLND
jgi:galactonate dehydratase